MPFYIQSLPGAPGVIPFQAAGPSLPPPGSLPVTTWPGAPSIIDQPGYAPKIRPGQPGYDPTAPGAFPPRVWPPRLYPDPKAPPFMPGIPDGPPGLYPDPKYPVIPGVPAVPPGLPRYPAMPRGRVPDETGRPWQPGDPLPGGKRPLPPPTPERPWPRNALGPILPKSQPAVDTPGTRVACRSLKEQFNNRAESTGSLQRKAWNGFNNLFNKAHNAFMTPGMTTRCLLDLDRILKALDQIRSDIIGDSTDLNYLQREINKTPCLEMVNNDAGASDTAVKAHQELLRLDSLAQNAAKDYKAWKEALQAVLDRCLPKKGGSIGQN